MDYKELEPKIVFQYFKEISNIPHGSGNTEEISKYLMNFANKEIDTQITAVYNLFRNATRMLFGFLASFILGITTSANALIIVGIIFTIIFIAIGQYMKTRLGLKPEEYSKEERKYDELKEIKKL